jgi:hypothetical protein
MAIMKARHFAPVAPPVSLALVRSAALVEASADLRGAPAGELHDRFVGWLSVSA